MFPGVLVFAKSKELNFILGSCGASWGEVIIKNYSEIFVFLDYDTQRWATKTIKVLSSSGRILWFFEKDIQIIR